MQDEPAIPAAVYLRMSTEDQRYSIPNQKATIDEYARRFGYQIVSTYADSGKSGVSIKNRSGLRTLLQDVMEGCTKFKAILVYDVSRWGRFQDADEAAHYEFICKEAGTPVRYCAEQFENDGTMPNSVMKALKRTMAAEYSRELSDKVYKGQRNLVLLGFKMGPGPEYGVRRMLVSEAGRHKLIMKPHERKNIKSDRTIIIPGPPKEVECVRRIFSMAVSKRNSPARISAAMNRQGFEYTDHELWTEGRVFRILTNPVYAGCNVWGRTKKFLGGQTSRLPPDRWASKSDAFTAIVDRLTFDRAQRAIQSRRTNPKKPDEYLLSGMRRVLAREGKLTQRLLKGRHIFDHRTYCKRFGSVLRAYELVGYQPPERIVKIVETLRKTRHLRTELLVRLKELFPEHLRLIHLPGQHQREVAELDGQVKIAIHLGRPVGNDTYGEPRWLVKAHREERGLPALICTVDPQVSRILNYYVVPEFGEGIKKCRFLSEKHPRLRIGQKLETLAQFYETAKSL
jgi:DNA invertase Pin-like site-specific DNA recombinase